MTEELSFISMIKQHIESGEMVLPVFSRSAMRIQQELKLALKSITALDIVNF